MSSNQIAVRKTSTSLHHRQPIRSFPCAIPANPWRHPPPGGLGEFMYAWTRAGIKLEQSAPNYPALQQSVKCFSTYTATSVFSLAYVMPPTSTFFTFIFSYSHHSSSNPVHLPSIRAMDYLSYVYSPCLRNFHMSDPCPIWAGAVCNVRCQRCVPCHIAP